MYAVKPFESDIDPFVFKNLDMPFYLLDIALYSDIIFLLGFDTLKHTQEMQYDKRAQHSGQCWRSNRLAVKLNAVYP